MDGSKAILISSRPILEITTGKGWRLSKSERKRVGHMWVKFRQRVGHIKPRDLACVLKEERKASGG